jgi:glycine/D-amino acid oxidase-like deaminating enzyme
MPGPTLDPVVTDNALPQKAEAVIIGGGIIGVSTALFLAERGVKVVLCEKGVLGGEQSSRNYSAARLFRRAKVAVVL